MNRAARRTHRKQEKAFKNAINKEAKQVNCNCGKVTYYHPLLVTGAFSLEYCSRYCSEGE